MDPDEIREWAEAYDAEYDDALHETERRLTERIGEQRYVTQDQLRDVVRWKLDNQGGRRGGNVDRVNRVPDRFVQRVSEAALLADEPKLQVKTLASIPGIGPATATVVLTFADPASYAVGDRYVMDVFFGDPKQMGATDYPRLLEQFRAENPGGFDLRTVEKAVYQRYRVEEGIA